jgi:hypothetical protein
VASLGDLSFPVALGLLGALLVAGIWIAAVTSLWFVFLATVVAVGLLTGLYLRSYAQRPHAAPPSRAPSVEEPFEDPVEEADRIASSAPGGPGETTSSPSPAPGAPVEPVSAPSLVGDDPQ